MYSLKVVPSQPKKLTHEQHAKYMEARALLKEYQLNKGLASEFKNIQYAANEMTEFIKEYRKRLKESKVDYVFSYQTANRTWGKLLGKIEWKFSTSAFSDRTIQMNKKHEMIHRGLFVGEDLTKMDQFKQMKEHIRTRFQEARKKARQLRIHNREKVINKLGIRVKYAICGGVMYNKIKPKFNRGESPRGYISKETGAIMRFLKSKDKKVVFEDKKPQAKDNYIGVEIEFFCDLDKEDLSFKLYEAGLGKYVCLKDDGSIKEDPGSYDHELCVLAKEKEIYSVIKELCDVLKLANAKVNKTCGLHVHLDMRSRDHEVIFHNLVSSQNVLFAMNPFSRQAGSYCKRVETKDFKVAASGDRYFGINATAFNKHRTIEIRIHSGTIMEEKINNWIKLLLTIASKKEAVKQSSSSLKGFIREYGIDTSLAKYIFERVAKFAGESKRNIEEKGAA